MNWREFKQAGHWPTLLSAFLYFDVSFMAWVVLGPLSLYLTQDLGLTIEEKFSVVAIPILAGALLRVPLGMLADHLGPKLTGSLAQMVVIAGMAYAWVFGVLLIPLGIVLVLYMLMAKDAPETRAPVTLANYANVLRDRDTWWFMFFYSITFGGFVGLGNALPLYFTNWYHTSGIAAGLMAAMVVMAGSMARPIGGILADRFGGIRTLELLFVLVALAYMTVAMLPQGPAPVVVGDAKVAGWALAELPGIAWLAVAVFFLSATALGMGNGSVFQLVPLRFRNEIGVMTGLVGAAGGIGGFFLAKALGISKGMTGGFMGGFTVFAGLAVIGLFGLMAVKTRWRTTWGAVSGAQV